MNCRRMFSGLTCSLVLLQTAIAGQRGTGLTILVLEGNGAQNVISESAAKPISVTAFISIDSGGQATAPQDRANATPAFSQSNVAREKSSRKMIISSAAAGGSAAAAIAAKAGGSGTPISPCSPSAGTIPTITLVNSSTGAPQ